MYEITSVASAKVISVPYDFKAVDKSKFAVVNTDVRKDLNIKFSC